MKHVMVVISVLLAAGVSYAQEDIEVSPQSHDFGILEIGLPATLTVTISNVGDKSIAINDIAFTADSSPDYAITSQVWLPLFFSAGGSFGFEITFTPSAPGPSTATLQIASSDPDEPVVDVVLTGQGLADELTPEEQIAAVIELAQASIEDGTLVGKGPGKSAANRLNALMNMLYSAEKLIQDGLTASACDQLDSIYKHMDGQPRPDDFVEGQALAQLQEMLQALTDSLNCD